jgi:hypothetical protein
MWRPRSAAAVNLADDDIAGPGGIGCSRKQEEYSEDDDQQDS